MAVFFWVGYPPIGWPVPGDKSDDAAPENVPDEGALQEKEEAEARPLDLDGLRILYLGSPILWCAMCIPACKNNGQDNGPGKLPVAKGISLQWLGGLSINYRVFRWIFDGGLPSRCHGGFDEDWFVRFLGARKQEEDRRSSVSPSNDNDIPSFLSWLSLGVETRRHGTLSLLRSVVPMYIINKTYINFVHQGVCHLSCAQLFGVLPRVSHQTICSVAIEKNSGKWSLV